MTSRLDALVRQAARGLAKAGLVHAYGHCSARIDADHFLVCAAKPMGLIRHDPGTIIPLDGPLPGGVLGEVRVHREIYRLRQDVQGICRIMPPAVMTLSTQSIVPAARDGLGAYLHGTRLWDDPRLMRNDARAAALAEALGDAPAIVMRGNGAVVVADGLEKAVTLSVFLESAACVERDIRAMNFDPSKGRLNHQEIVARQTFAGNVVERMWHHLTHDDAYDKNTMEEA